MLLTRIEGIWKSIKCSWLHFVYPSYCLHCDILIAPDQPSLCSNCAEALELINPLERCPFCFVYKEGMPLKPCENCLQRISLFQGVGAAFDYLGPAASIIKKLKYGNQPHLAKGAGAFLFAQLERLKWPIPDVIVPVPLTFMHWIDRGYNQSQLLAQSLAAFLDVPVYDVLERKSGEYSQAGLTLTQRKSLSGDHFKLRKDCELYDKTLLLIDDVLTTGSTLNRCAEVLLNSYPANLYALTFCRTL